MRIKAVFFDAGETLVYRNPALTTIVYRELRKNGWGLSGKKVDLAVRSAAESMRSIVSKAKMTDSQKWDVYVRSVFRKLGIKDPALMKKLKLKLKSGTSYRAHKDVHDVSEFLRKKRIITGIISNAPSVLDKILEKTGIRYYFKHILVSEKEGIEKPDKRIFMKAVKMAGVKPGEMLYVGDNFIADVQGARKAGIIPVWLLRRTKNAHFSFSHAAGPDKVKRIKSLRGLINLIQKENGL